MKKAIFILILALMFLPRFVFAAEYIASFDSLIMVHKDSSMTVIETITVNVENLEIKHGIYRDFPTKYKDDKGLSFNVAFEVLDVKLDGGAVPYTVSNFANGKRIKIGDPDKFVEAGIHVYEIKYQTKYQLGFFSDHDELYWNVTGNGWNFRIEKATATVYLSESIRGSDLKLEGYTGPQGAKEKNFNSMILSGSEIYFETTQALAPSEGLTIVVGWPKGLVQAPSKQEVAGQYAKSNLGFIFGMLGLIAGLVYYLIVWRRHGRDPGKGAVIPQYEPPQSLSPAEMRHIVKYRYDNKALAATIISLAVAGFLKITEEKKFFRKIYKLEKIKDFSGLASDVEKAMVEKLFKSKNLITIGDKYNKSVLDSSNRLRNDLKKKMKQYYRLNLGFWFGGIGIFTLGFILMAIFGSVSWKIFFFIYAVIAFLAIIVFAILLRQPTVDGRKVMDEILGFKWFLEVTEKDRLNFFNPPEKTPELFEKFLPYALALGVEHQWAEQFAAVFKQMETQGTPYTPVWYSGSGWNMANITGFTIGISHSVSGAISASSVKPGSSSGFGGGGGSGGGGGGGGGGGW